MRHSDRAKTKKKFYYFYRNFNFMLNKAAV